MPNPQFKPIFCHRNYDPGFIPGWLKYEAEGGSAKSAIEVFNRHYAHGGGWHPFKGFKLRSSDFALVYPGDPPEPFRCAMAFGEEMVYMYDHAWVVIIKSRLEDSPPEFVPEDLWEVARMD